MAIFDITTIKYIFRCSLTSRLIILLLQVAANSIIPDHNADAYTNKYQQAISTNNSGATLTSSAQQHGFNLIEGFTRWDAQYFLEISMSGYVSEQHLAFLPFLPITIACLRQSPSCNLPTINNLFVDSLKDEITQDSIQNYIISAWLCVLINNFILFPLAATCLFILTKTVKSSDENYARRVVWWFCYNPASVFFSTCYTESLFAALTFAAMSIIEYRANNWDDHDNNPDKTSKATYSSNPVGQVNRLLNIFLPSLAFIALSTATRSNGLITIGLLVYHFMLKYMPIVRYDRSRWSLAMHFFLLFEFIQDTLVMIISIVISGAGYISFQIYSYIKFCSSDEEKGSLSLRPDWCYNNAPHPYSTVQAKYWNVGLFKYYKIRQLPNFILAAPITILVLLGIWSNLNGLAGQKKSKRYLVYYMQVIILLLFCNLTINIQVTTRLLASACPAVFWIATDLADSARYKRKLVKTYFITYYILGTVLHVNFFPWT